jgi:hypothetical protein
VTSSGEALVAPPLESLQCIYVTPDPGDGDPSSSGSGGRKAQLTGAHRYCAYESVTTTTNPGACGDDNDVPDTWSAYGCTRGVTVYYDGGATARIWACPTANLPPVIPLVYPQASVCPMVPNSPNFPAENPNCEIVVTGAAVTENACVGNALSNWSLVEDWTYIGPVGHLCPSGCPTK